MTILLNRTLPSRSRALQVIAMVLVIGAGLLLRSRLCPLPLPVTKYGGDGLWALVAFLGLGFLFLRMTTWRLGAVAFGFSCLIESLQLYHAPWIDTIRATRVGFLILGATFHLPDILAYAGGIGLGVAWEVLRQVPVGRC